jgi:hypothetical protein
VLEDPKTYTRPIKNERVFVYSPDIELMEYACMENNLQSLLDGAITPWVGPTASSVSVVPARWEWTSFDLTSSKAYTGVVKELTWDRDTIALARIDIGGKMYDVMLGLPIRMDFRGLAEQDVVPGTTLTFQAVSSRQRDTDLRAQTLTVGKTTKDMR